jgi:aspartate aminotransferase
MPSISNKAVQMPASPIRKLVPFAEAAKKKGTKIYHLNIGQPDIVTPDSFLNAIRNADMKIVEYSHSAGNESYRKKLCGYYQSYNIQIDPNEVMITCGGSEAIAIAMFTCFNPGDEIIIPEPFYANYNGFSRSADVVVKPVRSYIENGFALPPISEFEKQITANTRGIMICNPGNPTGGIFNVETIKKIISFAVKNRLVLIADEVYRQNIYK